MVTAPPDRLGVKGGTPGLVSTSDLLRYTVGVAVGDDRPTKRRYRQSGDVKGLYAERDANDGHEQKQTADGVTKRQQEAGNYPKDVADQASRTNAWIPDSLPGRRATG